MPHKYRLGLQTDGNHKKFTIAMHWLAGSSWSLEQWEGDEEAGLALHLVVVSFDKARYEQRSEYLTLIGMHAIGRWFQRSFNDDETNLLNDLKPLGFADLDAKQVPTRDGWWACEKCKAPDGRVLLRAVTYKHPI